MAGPGRSLRPGCTAPGRVAAVGCARAWVAMDRHAITLAGPSAMHQIRDGPRRLLQIAAELTKAPRHAPKTHAHPYADDSRAPSRKPVEWKAKQHAMCP